MSGASNYLDPVEAVQDEIRRSKRVVASALDDLGQHHSWLESYHRDERRRAQRLRRQETLRALELRRQRAAWIARRFAKASFVMMLTTAVFLTRNGAAFLAWALPRARALALLLARQTSAATRTGRVLARKSYQCAAIGFTWTVRTSDVLGIAFRKRLSTGAALLYAEAATHAQPILRPALKRASAGWIRARFRSKRLAFILQTGVTDAWSWTRHKVPILARKGCKGVVNGFVWTVHSTDTIGIAFRKRLSTGAALLYAKAATHAQSIVRPTLKKTSASWIRTRLRWKRLASTLCSRAPDSWSRTRFAFGWTCARSQHLACAAFEATSKAWSQAALRSRTVLETRGPQHRALIVRQCTALVCTPRHPGKNSQAAAALQR